MYDLGIVATRRSGNNICYRIADPCVTTLLDRGLCLMESDAWAPKRGRKRSGGSDPPMA